MAVTAVLVLSACVTSAAQDVDGISVWDKYTKAQLVQKYGQPVEYRSQEGDNEGDGLIESITQVSQVIQAAAPARSSRSKACFTALI